MTLLLRTDSNKIYYGVISIHPLSQFQVNLIILRIVDSQMKLFPYILLGILHFAYKQLIFLEMNYL